MSSFLSDEKRQTVISEPESERSQNITGDGNMTTVEIGGADTLGSQTMDPEKGGLKTKVKDTYSSTKRRLRPFKPYTDFLQTWGLLIIHLIFISLLTFCIIYWVSDLRVNAGNKRLSTSRRMYILGDAVDPQGMTYFTSKDWLLPGDITTVVSTGLVLIKLVTGSWTGLTAWRCACIILEKECLTFREIKFMVSYRMGCWPRGRYSWTTLIILLLLVPAQLSGPLVSGSISWIQTPAFVAWDRGVEVFPSSGGDPTRWDEYIRGRETREQVLTEALSYSWSLYYDSVAEDDNGCRRRTLNTGLRDNSVVRDITVPCLRFNSITWERDLPPQEILNKMTQPDIGLLKEENSPIHHIVEGNVGMLDMERWDGREMYHGSPPSPTIFNKPRLVAFLFTTVPGNGICPTTYVEPRSGTQSAVHALAGEVKKGCYTFARVSFIAGTTVSDAKVVSPGVVQSESNAKIVANEFTNEAVFMLNNLMMEMALSDPNQLVSNHTSAIMLALNRGYVAAWNSLQFRFGDNGGTRRRDDLKLSGATQRVDLLQGVVTYWRVWMWVALNLLITLSGFILWGLQRKCKRLGEKSFSADALLMDTSDVLEEKLRRRTLRENGADTNVQLMRPLRVHLKKAEENEEGRFRLAVYRPTKTEVSDTGTKELNG